MTYLQIRGRGEVEKACTYTLSSNVCNFNNQKSEIKHKTNQIPIFLYVFSDAIKSKNNKNGWYFFLTHPVKRIFIFHTLLIDSTCLLLCWDSYGKELCQSPSLNITDQKFRVSFNMLGLFLRRGFAKAPH